MFFDLACIAIFALVSVGFVAVSLVASSWLQPKVAHQDKTLTYECGERPVGDAWIQFNLRFYVVALIFVIFDLEIAFMVPVLVVFRSWVERGLGWVGLAEIGVFVAVLAVGLAYVWVKRDLDWIKPAPKSP
ncbi:MAG: NADH-quinone oxidoreductase subunit A [Deltaproteobacteria bacterium]|nr:NADH-quinone oxidoreductase subunit A [Deltaproteobacteria bacterium]